MSDQSTEIAELRARLAAAEARTAPAPIVINNSAAAAATAYAGHPVRRRRQSAAVHVVLFLFTAGIGNLFYAVSVSRWNARHGL